MSVQKNNSESTAHLIDSEPILVLGCSNTEIMSLAMVGAASGLIIGIVLAVVFGHWMIALPFPVIAMVASVYWGGGRLGKNKEGKPDGYYGRQFKVLSCQLQKNKLLIHRAGAWRIRR